MNIKTICITLIFVLLPFASLAQGDNTCFVSTLATACFGVPHPTCPSISQCVTKFNATTIKVHPGNYKCEVPFSTQNDELYINAYNDLNPPVYTCSDEYAFLNLSSTPTIISISNIIVKSVSTGGCIHLSNAQNLYGNSLILNNTIFDGCTSINTNGGAINSNGYTLNIYNSVFSNCHSYKNGGAIYATSSVYFHGSSISASSAKLNGGAIYAYDYVNIQRSTFSENSSKQKGGAIYNIANRIYTHDSTFTLNSANVGGAIATAFSNGISAGSSEFTSNSASNRGGAIAFVDEESSDSTPTLYFSGSIFTNNSAAQGGAVFFPFDTFSGEYTVLGGSFINSSSSDVSSGQHAFPASIMNQLESYGCDINFNFVSGYDSILISEFNGYDQDYFCLYTQSQMDLINDNNSDDGFYIPQANFITGIVFCCLVGLLSIISFVSTIKKGFFHKNK
eukprot:gene18396-22017_t